MHGPARSSSAPVEPLPAMLPAPMLPPPPCHSPSPAARQRFCASSLLDALFCIDFEAQDCWVASLDESSQLRVLAVSRRLRAAVEPHLRRAVLRTALSPTAPSDWLRAVDNFFALVARRPRCVEVVMALKLPASKDAAAKLALAFESAADSGCLSQVTKLELGIDTDVEGRLPAAMPAWGRRPGTTAPVGLAQALSCLFPRLTQLSLTGSWLRTTLTAEAGAADMYAAWTTGAGCSGPLAGLRSLEVEPALHFPQSSPPPPQVSRLVLPGHLAGVLAPEPLALPRSYRETFQKVAAAAAVVAPRRRRAGLRPASGPEEEQEGGLQEGGLQELVCKWRGGGLFLGPGVDFPPDLHELVLGQAGGQGQRGAAAAAAGPRLRRLELQGYSSTLPRGVHIGAELEDAEIPGACTFVIRSLAFDQRTFTYHLSTPTLTAVHIREWLELCDRPLGPPAAAAAAAQQPQPLLLQPPSQPPRRLSVEITVERLSPPEGPLGAGSAAEAWADVASIASRDRRHSVSVLHEAHAGGLPAACRMVAAMATGVLRVPGDLVVHWDGWYESPDVAHKRRGRGGGGGGGGGGGAAATVPAGGLPSLMPTAARIEDLAHGLTALPPERRPKLVRLVLCSRRSGGGSGGEVLPEGVEALRLKLKGSCSFKAKWV